MNGSSIYDITHQSKEIESNEALAQFIAHMDGERIQTCEQHCINVAEYAKSCLEKIGLGETGYIAGILHDCGKFTDEFRQYIIAANDNKKVNKGSVIHSFAGLYYLLNKFHNNEISDFSSLSAELIAIAIASHHGSIDCVDKNGTSGFTHRMTKQPLYEQRAINNYIQKCKCDKELESLFKSADAEIRKLLNKLLVLNAQSEDELFFYLGLSERLILSALIDADRRDTAEFMCKDRLFRIYNADEKMWAELLDSEEKYLASFDYDTEIKVARKELSDKCKAFAENATGIYRLNLPTGGGKTLSGLRFALSHAKQYNKSRIFYIAPLISILDQNADVIRKAINNNELVLEHHSNIIIDDENGEEYNKYSLLSETWNSPIVITTLVQLLNTLFSSKTSCIRRFQALCNSVIIIDEVQTVPTRLLSLFNLAMNFLAEICNATVLLCSATQPCLHSVNHSMKISSKAFLKDDEAEKYNKIFKRTNIVYKGDYSIDEFPDIVSEIMQNKNSLLIVANKRSESESLFKLLNDKGNDYKCFHLSASMCVAHRKKVLQDITSALANKERVLCISTQVIEAGVDISFESVIRISAGIDSIVQAAGRCNRNGESVYAADVFIVRCNGEDLRNLPEIADAKAATNELIEEFNKNCSKFDNDLASQKAVDYYYNRLYKGKPENYQDFAVKGYGTLYELLSSNSTYVSKCEDSSIENYSMRQAFKTAGSLFEVFDSNTSAVIVPWSDDAKKIISELCSEKALHDIAYANQLLKKAKEYSISLFSYQLDKLKREDGIYLIYFDSVYVLQEDWYDKNIGLTEGGSKECNIQIL